ncbi:MAG: hypothetical protein P4M13_10800 [Alphaproteobacteria bacterium]|nr:hypothetical protein [Alphaproteobacteria bacterium]
MAETAPNNKEILIPRTSSLSSGLSSYIDALTQRASGVISLHRRGQHLRDLQAH